MLPFLDFSVPRSRILGLYKIFLFPHLTISKYHSNWLNVLRLDHLKDAVNSTWNEAEIEIENINKTLVQSVQIFRI